MDFVNFKKEVSKRLIDIDMSRSELAKRMGISEAYLTDLLKGNRRSSAKLYQIANIIGLDYKLVPNSGK